MENKTYHHGDLKRALIETGIKLINEKGESGFSLRKVAALCGVSNAAPYAHFKDKEELLSAMKEHVTEEFMNVLQEAIRENPCDRTLITQMGKAYVMFFIRNPHYFSFLFSQSDIVVDLSAEANTENNYPPFTLFQQTVLQVMEKSNSSPKQSGNLIIALWALVHGLASIATMKNVLFDDDWENKIEVIMKSLTREENKSECNHT